MHLGGTTGSILKDTGAPAVGYIWVDDGYIWVYMGGWILLDMAAFQKKWFFALYGFGEGLVWCKILPQGVGTICSYFRELIFLLKSRSVNYFLWAYFGILRCLQHAAGVFVLLGKHAPVFCWHAQLTKCVKMYQIVWNGFRFHYQTVLEQCKTNCSITRLCWNSAKPIVPSPDGVGTVQNQLFQHLPKLFPKVWFRFGN